MITFPLWFKFFLGGAVFVIIWETYLFLCNNKEVDYIKRLPDEQREKAIKAFYFITKLQKIFLWSAPVYLILMPYIFYLYQPKELFHFSVMIIIAYVITIEDFFYRRSILSKVNGEKIKR